MSNQQNNPKMDFGFHAMIPRIIRTDYKNLTAVQKWLYVCLKDLCGNHGTCYRSLRVLAEETGISTGMLSESIPVLHTAGLIHAEKKKRSTGGKEVWHITIVDIWIANGKAHPTKRSQNEQTLEEQEENVHTVNNNVHRMNKLTKERSQNEQERSLCETEVIEDKQEDIKAREDRQESVIVVTANADANDTPALPEKTQETPAEQPQEKKRATRKPRAKKFEIAAELQDRVKMVYEHLDAWRQEITGDPEEHFSHDVESDQSICSLFDGKPPTHKKLKQVCNDLWNEPRNTRSGYWAREHMTIPFICKQYKAKSILLAASDKKPQEQQPTSYSVGGYTYNPEQEVDAPELKFVGPYRNRKRKGA